MAFSLIGKQALGALTVGAASVANLALNAALIPRFGYKGAAVATLLAFVLQIGLCLALNRRLELLRVPLVRPLLLTLAAAATQSLL